MTKCRCCGSENMEEFPENDAIMCMDCGVPWKLSEYHTSGEGK